jgi:hypothetical protein
MRLRLRGFNAEEWLKGLWPREHGAYAQLGFPLVTGLIYGHGQAGALAFAVAAVAIFLAHEPMAVIMGMRGVRLRDTLVGPSRRRLWVLAVVVVLALGTAALVAPGRAWRAALVPGLLGLLLVPLFFIRRIKTLAGEVVVAATLSASLAPLALSGPGTWAGSWLAAAVWFGAAVPAIVSVHGVKALHKGTPRSRWLVPGAPGLALVVLVAAVLVAWALPSPAGRAVAVVPSSAVVLGVAVVRPHPRHLKRIGWTMVVANLTTLVLLLML